MSPRPRGAFLGIALALTLALPATGPAEAAPSHAAATGVTARHGAATPAGHTGRWRVDQTGADTFRVTWRSARRLPITSDRPEITTADGAPLGLTSLARNGRTVHVDVHTTTAPDPATLDVLLSGDRLDEPGDDVRRTVGRIAASKAGPRARATELLADDPATPGTFATTTSDYQLDPVKLPGMPEPIEMVGHVVEPTLGAATGPRPLVLFMHGRHSFCYRPGHPGDDSGGEWNWPCRAPYQEIPSHLGYDYIQQVLATQGFATVSVRVNGINAQDWVLDDGGADARAAIVRQHLDYWTSIAADHHVDVSKVILVGHSRGGEGVDRASMQIPLSAPYRIAGQVLLAPTDFGTQTAAYVPTVTVLPYCDGDVYDLQGQRFTDTGRDLTTDDTSLKSSVLVMGANHNFFNSEWTPGVAQAPAWDDWGDESANLCGTANPDRLSAAEQRSVGVAYVAGAVHLFTRDEAEYLPLYDGSAASVASTGDAVVYSHAIGGGRTERRPAVDSGLSLPTGGAESQLCVGAYDDGSRSPNHTLCGRGSRTISMGNTPHWPARSEFVVKRRALEMSWTAAGQSAGLVFDDPLDLAGGRRLELRTIVDPTRGDVALKVRLTDADGHTATLDPVGGDALPALPAQQWLAKRWAQSVIVDPAGSGIDLHRVTGVDLVAQNDRGRVWVLDAASAPATLAPVPDKRLALISVGRAVIDEGDGRSAVARVPFEVTGTLSRRASVIAATLSYGDRYQVTTSTLDLAPGQTSGEVLIDYAPNNVDDSSRRIVDVALSPMAGVMTDDYLGRLVIRDDDPTPRISVRVAGPVVREGRPLQVSVRLAARTGYALGVVVAPVRGTGSLPRLTLGDLPRRWVKTHYVDPKLPPSTPLEKAGLASFGLVRQGRTSYAMAIPTRRDHRHEGREQVTLKVRVYMPGPDTVVTRRVVVTD